MMKSDCPRRRGWNLASSTRIDGSVQQTSCRYRRDRFFETMPAMMSRKASKRIRKR